MSIARLMKHLDSISFLGISIWDFCSRSLFKEYGRRFLKGAILSHPLKTVRGLRGYRKFLMIGHSNRIHHQPFLVIGDALPENIGKAASNHLVGLGFCLKPYHPQKHGFSCPSGRANHDCIYLDKGKTQPVCLDCTIFKIAAKSLQRDFRVYIMTSAEDMAQDFLIPQIKSDEFPSSLLFLCPFSIQAILPAIFICGAESILVPYSKGNCSNYEQWRKADLGHKDEMTDLDAATWENVLDFFAASDPIDPSPDRFKRRGNIFYPIRNGFESKPPLKKEKSHSAGSHLD